MTFNRSVKRDVALLSNNIQCHSHVELIALGYVVKLIDDTPTAIMIERCWILTGCVGNARDMLCQCEYRIMLVN